MEVILRKHVENLGGINEIVKVKDGFARNYLFPNNMAIPATSGNVKNLSAKIEAAKTAKAKRVEEARGIASKYHNINLRVVAKAGREGKLFGSVTTQDIADLLQARTGMELDKKKILLQQAIKRTGVYIIIIKLEVGVSATVNLDVVGEDQYAEENQGQPMEGHEGHHGHQGHHGHEGHPDEGYDQTGHEGHAEHGGEEAPAAEASPSRDGGKKKRKKHVNEAELELPE